ncbi:MAG: hypothetical protein AAGF14_09395 [Pseudomonadota bacterium]
MDWKRYWKLLIASVFAIAALLVTAVWVINPYSNLPFSPSFERRPIATNQRYSYPAIARDPAFDSVVLGTSTARLLKPQVLDAEFGARFANLSMNSGTPYEQMRIGTLFANQRPEQRALIIGLDRYWCEVGEAEKYTFRSFPEWMYDANPWNDLPNMIEFQTFQDVMRQAGYLLGVRSQRYGPDGYANFLPPVKKYDLAKVRKNIYGSSKPRLRKVAAKPKAPKAFPRDTWTYGNHPRLEALLRQFSPDAKKVLVFVPYHRHKQAAAHTERGAQWEECKKRVSEIARRFPNTTVLDFMIDSPITTRDENYWDPLHYTNAVADELARLIVRGSRGEPAPDGEYDLLVH